MPVPVKDFVWEQGADLTMSMVYKAGPVGSEVGVDLTNYQLRMDISSSGKRIYTFNTNDITDIDGGGPGTDSDLIKEAVLGTDGSIEIAVPRSLTLPPGIVYTEIVADRLVYNYDVFLRDNNNKQFKLLTGKITVNKSVTLWN